MDGPGTVLHMGSVGDARRTRMTSTLVGALVAAIAWGAPSASAFVVYNNTDQEVEARVLQCDDLYVRDDDDCDGGFEDEVIAANTNKACNWRWSKCNPSEQRDKVLRADIEIAAKRFACRVHVRAGGWVSVYQHSRTYAGLRATMSKEYSCVARYQPEGGSEVVDDREPRYVGDPTRHVSWLATGDPQYQNGDDDRRVTSDRTLSMMNYFLERANTLRGALVAGDLTQNSRAIDEFGDYRWAIDDLGSDSRVSDADLYFDLNPGGTNRFFFDTVGNHDRHGDDDGASSAACVFTADACVDRHAIKMALERRSRTTPLTKNGHDEGAGLYSWDWHDVHFANVGNAAMDENPSNEGTDDACDDLSLSDHLAGTWVCSDPDPDFVEVDPGKALTFLKDDLRENVGSSGRPVVINQHYGFDQFARGCGSGSTDRSTTPPTHTCSKVEVWWTKQQIEKFWDAIAGYNVVAIYVGHSHLGPSDTDWATSFPRPSGRTNGPDSVPVFHADAALKSVFLLSSIGDEYADGTDCDPGLNETCLLNVRYEVYNDGQDYRQIGRDLRTIDDTPDPNTKATLVLDPDPSPSTVGQAVRIGAEVQPATGKPTPTGTVTFLQDGQEITTCQDVALVDGKAHCDRTFTEYLGGHVDLTLSYSGDSEHAPGTSGVFQHNLARAGTTTTLTSNAPASIVTGQAIKLTATVARDDAGTTPTGNVDFFNDADAITACQDRPLSAAGVATCDTTIGGPFHPTNPIDSFIADYEGTDAFEVSWDRLNVTVAKADTTATVTGPATAVTGQVVEYVLDVTADAPGGGKPDDGLVEFTRDGTKLCDNVNQIDGGRATCGLDVGDPGTRKVTGAYLGGNHYKASGPSAEVTTTVSKGQVTASITTNPVGSASVTGQSVSFNARLSAKAPARGIPTGTADFLEGTTVRCADVAINGSGDAGCAFVPTGGALSVRYDGSSQFEAATLPFAHTITKAQTTTKLTVTPDPAKVGQGLTLTAEVAAKAPGGGTPGGEVYFLDTNGSDVCVPTTLSNGRATCSVAATAPGEVRFVVAYDGSAGYLGSSDEKTVTVVKATSEVSVSSSKPSSVNREPVTFSSWVTHSPANNSASGSIVFRLGSATGSVLCTKPVSIDAEVPATCTASLPAGTHQVVAVYAGTPNVEGDTSSVQQTVAKGDVGVVVQSSKSPSEPGEAVTISAAVSPVAPAQGAPGGTVDFSGACEDVALVDGVASCLTTPSASRTIVATYSGSGEFAGGEGQVVQVVKKRTTTALRASVNPSVTGQPVTFTATVAAEGATPTGTVAFSEGTTSRCAAVAVSSSGTATCTFVPAGSATIRAAYGGTSTLATSSATVEQRVDKAATAVTYTQRALPDSQVRLRAVVAAQAPGAGTPGGSVSFGDQYGTFPGCGAATLVDGTATCVVAFSRLRRSATSTATYGGSASYLGSSAPVRRPVD